MNPTLPFVGLLTRDSREFKWISFHQSLLCLTVAVASFNPQTFVFVREVRLRHGGHLTR